MAVTHDMTHSFDVVDALPRRRMRRANLIAPRHGADRRHGTASRRKYVPPTAACRDVACQVTDAADAERQEPILRAIVECELHERIFQAPGR